MLAHNKKRVKAKVKVRNHQAFFINFRHTYIFNKKNHMVCFFQNQHENNRGIPHGLV